MQLVMPEGHSPWIYAFRHLTLPALQPSAVLLLECRTASNVGITRGVAGVPSLCSEMELKSEYWREWLPQYHRCVPSVALIIAVGAFHALVLVLSLNAQCRDRTRFDTT